MNEQEKNYADKLMTAEQAVSLLPEKMNMVVGMAVSQPPALLAALAERVSANKIESLSAYYMHSTPAMHDTILRYELLDKVKPHPFFLTHIERELMQRGSAEGKQVIYYTPANFSNVIHLLTQCIQIDACVVMVSPMDERGYFSCGTNCDYTVTAARQAKQLLVEVNPNMPRTHGDTFLHISEVDGVVEHESSLFEISTREPTVVDQEICQRIVELIPDKATLQMGLGSIPELVCQQLVNHQDLGVHSEMIGSGLCKLIESGAVTNRYKKLNRYKNVFTFALGNKHLYDFLDDNPCMQALPVDYVNNAYVIAQNDNVISVNSFIEIDLFGQVNAEYLRGRQFSAPGGQLDFIRGAILSKGGKSILAAPSTAASGTVSRIVPRITGPATDPRADVQYVITEYGVADLFGKSADERAAALIRIAHPDHREALTMAARSLFVGSTN